MENANNAIEVLANLLYLIDLSRTEPQKVARYVEMAQPAIQCLQDSFAGPNSFSNSHIWKLEKVA